MFAMDCQTTTSGRQGASYFRRYGRELVSKPAISLEKSWGGYCRTTHLVHGLFSLSLRASRTEEQALGRRSFALLRTSGRSPRSRYFGALAILVQNNLRHLYRVCQVGSARQDSAHARTYVRGRVGSETLASTPDRAD